MLKLALALGLMAVAGLVVLLEIRGRARPEWLDNLGLGASRGLFELASRGAQVGIYEGVRIAVAARALETADVSTWLIAFFGYDFLYYWAHRAAHRSGLLWASHAVHHQATEMNLTVGLRAALTNSFAHLPFFLPIAVIGVPSGVFLGVSVAHLLAMTWLHTTRIGSLPRIEGWLNTPALHAVHHGAEAAHIDKNFGGVLIVYDRLFGTFAPATPVARFGLAQGGEAPGPVAAHLQPWREWLGGAGLKARCERAHRPRPRRGWRGRR